MTYFFFKGICLDLTLHCVYLLSRSTFKVYVLSACVRFEILSQMSLVVHLLFTLLEAIEKLIINQMNYNKRTFDPKMRILPLIQPRHFEPV